MTTLEFIKMHGLGNDFVIIDHRDKALTLSPETVRAICDRNLGVGCDQFIILEQSIDPIADVCMRIYNPDGTESGACGNAARCVASQVMTESAQSSAIIQTRAGLLDCEKLDDGLYSVDMGPARSDWRDLPLAQACDTDHINVAAGPLSAGVGVNIGNPHVVFMVDNALAVDLNTFGPQIEHHSMFPERTNVEVVQIGRAHV